MKHMPFPSNENGLTGKSIAKQPKQEPWNLTKPSEQQPNMFQVQLLNGNVISFAYCDLREARLLSAGYLRLCVYGMEKYHVIIEGRHLTDLAELISNCKIKSLTEMGLRTFEHPESCPSIDKITIETLTGPAY